MPSQSTPASPARTASVRIARPPPRATPAGPVPPARGRAVPRAQRLADPHRERALAARSGSRAGSVPRLPHGDLDARNGSAGDRVENLDVHDRTGTAGTATHDPA